MILDLNSICEKGTGAMYEELKNRIISCMYTAPLGDTFYGIKVKTIAMLRKMIDPDSQCCESLKETLLLRQAARIC